MRKAMLIIAIVLVVSVIVVGCSGPEAVQAAQGLPLKETLSQTDTAKVGNLAVANAVTKAVSALDGVSRVDVDLAAKTVAVECDKTPLELIQSEIEEQGYDVTGSSLLHEPK